MTAADDLKKYSVLYVDDEEQSLKYFPKLFGSDLSCLTASSIAEARTIIQREGGRIGVVISDQRMPGGSGVELLGWLANAYPQTVRILTTAYADLDSAISAVNSGAVFRYVVKPWDHREMFGVLARAMEFHLVTRERDTLLNEKLTAMQQVVLLDRRRSFAMLASGLSQRLRNPLAALRTYLDCVPAATQPAGESIAQLWTIAQRESRRLGGLATSVSRRLLPAAPAYSPNLQIKDLLAAGLKQAQQTLTGNATMTVAPSSLSISADGGLVIELVNILVGLALHADPSCKAISIAAEGCTLDGGPGVCLRIHATSPAWQSGQLARIHAAMTIGADSDDHDADLLTACFIVHHHCGTLTMHAAHVRGPGFEVLLPVDPAVRADQALPHHWVDDILTFQQDA